MKIISKDLRDGENCQNATSSTGWGIREIISLRTAWDDVPAGTKSFVVTCYDPDAPTGSGWWHWVVANLPADTRVLPQGSGSDRRPAGRCHSDAHRFWESRLRWRSAAKGETHRYIFTVHALDVEKIEVDEGASGAMVGFNVHFHSLESASITAMYS